MRTSIHITILCFGLALTIASCKKDKDEEEEPLQILKSEFCEDTCTFSNDGECDDGASNSSSDYCEYGTDCTDCGLRTLVEVVD